MPILKRNSKVKKKLTKGALTLGTTAIMMGGITAGFNKQKPYNKPKTELESNDSTAKHKNQKEMNFGEYKKMLAPITPYIMLELILNEGIKLDDTGTKCVPYQDSRGIWTIAFGVTTTSDGKKVSKNTKPIPIERAWDESIHFLESRETYFLMYCYDVGCPNLRMDTPARLCAYASVFYNAGTKLMEEPSDKNHRERNETLRKLYQEYGDNVTPEMVRECFAKYPIVAPRSFGECAINGAPDRELADVLGLYVRGGRGLWTRRWLEGQIMMGNVNPAEFLNLPIQATYEFFLMQGGKRNVFWSGKDKDTKINMKTLPAFNTWLANPVTRDGKTPFRGQSIGQLLNKMNPEILKLFEQNNGTFAPVPYLDKKAGDGYKVADSLYFLANADFMAGDYAAAAQKFKTLALKNPKDAQIFNDLAATYNKMGAYKDALSVIDFILNKIKDKSAFAAAYYNAGVAREGMGEYDKALINYRKAIENGNKSSRVSNAIKRVELNKNLAMQNKGGARV